MSTSGDGTQAPEDEADTSFDPCELSHKDDWRQISEGGYSEVYKAWLLGATVAVKQASARKKTSGEALLREIRYLKLAGPHPNIIQPYGAFSERGKLNLVMEYARHSLRSDRVARSADPLVVLAGVARALVRLHGLGIIHRDLKAPPRPCPRPCPCPPGPLPLPLQPARRPSPAVIARPVGSGAQRAGSREQPRAAHRLRLGVPRAARLS